jgi:hypothetical protein
MKKAVQLKEQQLRNYLRNEIRKYLKEVEEEETPAETPETPEEEEQDPEEVIAQVTGEFVRKLKSASFEVGTEELVSAMTLIMESWGLSSEQKLNILKSVKVNTVR